MPLLLPVNAPDADGSIAVDEFAVLVGKHRSVGVAVKGNADIGSVLHRELLNELGLGCAAFRVDVDSIRRYANGNYLGAESAKHFRAEFVSSAMGGIHGDAHAFQPFGEQGNKKIEVALDGAMIHKVAANGCSGEPILEVCGQQILHRFFRFVRQLCAVMAHEFDPVSGAGLWLAEIIPPNAKSPVRATKETVGVGTTPRDTTLTPTEQNPADRRSPASGR